VKCYRIGGSGTFSEDKHSETTYLEARYLPKISKDNCVLPGNTAVMNNALASYPDCLHSSYYSRQITRMMNFPTKSPAFLLSTDTCKDSEICLRKSSFSQ
jgi:hypothetical protein